MRRLLMAMVGLGIAAALAIGPWPAQAERARGDTVVLAADEGAPAISGTAQRPSQSSSGKSSSGKSSSARVAKPRPTPPAEPRRDQLALAALPELVADGILVIKSERRLYLLRQGRAVRAYDVALGFNPVGHKLHEGDGRTPEGLYVLGEALPESRFYRALPISYPAPDDVERARALGLRPGGRIMIHGLPPSGARMGRQHLYLDWTDGCVAVTNEEIDEIALAVRPGTPIEIRP